MRSARYIGQRWTDFTAWVDIMAPMNYRSHFQGSFEDYLNYLKDYIRTQIKWCEGKSHLYPGVTGHYIYKEEREPWDEAINILSSEESVGLDKDELKKLMAKNIAYLERFSPERAAELGEKLSLFLQGKTKKEILLEEIRNVLRDPPSGFFPEEKLLKTIETIRKAGAKGVVIFSAGIISRNKLWPTLEKAFTNKNK